MHFAERPSERQRATATRSASQRPASLSLAQVFAPARFASSLAGLAQNDGQVFCQLAGQPAKSLAAVPKIEQLPAETNTTCSARPKGKILQSNSKPSVIISGAFCNKIATDIRYAQRVVASTKTR